MTVGLLVGWHAHGRALTEQHRDAAAAAAAGETKDDPSRDNDDLRDKPDLFAATLRTGAVDPIGADNCPNQTAARDWQLNCEKYRRWVAVRRGLLMCLPPYMHSTLAIPNMFRSCCTVFVRQLNMCGVTQNHGCIQVLNGPK